MPKPLSRHAKEALAVLGQQIRMARLGRRMKAADLAERAGISRGLLARIEKGDPTCAIGGAFEVASILGLPLFESDRQPLGSRIAANASTLALLPSAVRNRGETVDDDF